MQENKTIAPERKCERISLLKALGVIGLTMLLALPILMVANETENLWINLIGLAYLALVVFLLHTCRGRQWTDLVSRANDRIFGRYAPTKSE